MGARLRSKPKVDVALGAVGRYRRWGTASGEQFWLSGLAHCTVCITPSRVLRLCAMAFQKRKKVDLNLPHDIQYKKEKKRMTYEEKEKIRELERKRKIGEAPLEIDEDGREVNPHIPKFISEAPCTNERRLVVYTTHILDYITILVNLLPTAKHTNHNIIRL